MLTLLLSLLAGALSTLSPCVLPIVPIIMSSAMQAARFGPVALLAGVALSYTLVGTGLALFGSSLGVEPGQVRMVSAALMLGFGAMFLSSRLQQAFVLLVAPLTAGAGARVSGLKADSTWGQGLLGLMLGLVWSPCVGPTLGAAVTLAAQGHSAAVALSTMFVFGLGAALPMGLLAYGSRAAMASRRRAMGEAGRWGKRVMGLGLVLVGGLVLSGADHGLEALLTRHMPPWLVDLTTRF
ncbi:MAG: sulfite exporter TauE/SafE family protein [Burkholderiaceae bacterium]|nr:sulfite exporter TauE/SafE family protein [Burkholderiaceae bacterium]